MKSVNSAVLIGRFQFPHHGHEQLIRHAVRHYDHLVIIIGSSNQARSPKNPLTYEERSAILAKIVERVNQEEQRHCGVSFAKSNDYVYNNQKWISEIQTTVKSVLGRYIKQLPKDQRHANTYLMGCLKDDSSYYLNLFPEWKKDFIDLVNQDQVGRVERHELLSDAEKVLSSTTLRQQFFNLLGRFVQFDNSGAYTLNEDYRQHCQLLMKHDSTLRSLDHCFHLDIGRMIDLIELRSFLLSVLDKVWLQNLVNEFQYYQHYRQMMKQQLPFQSIPFFTGDCVVTCAGHILLIQRKIAPGKGLWALAGGFMDKDRDLYLEDTALRKLKEETNIDCPLKVLKGCIRDQKMFGEPQRSLRWRVIANCLYIVLSDETLPKVKATHDAIHVKWVPFSWIKSNQTLFFEDHVSIIDSFLNIL